MPFKQSLRKELENSENAEIYRSIGKDLLVEIGVTEVHKKELHDYLESYETGKKRAKAVSSKMDELKGKLRPLDWRIENFFIKKLMNAVVILKNEIGVEYGFKI